MKKQLSRVTKIKRNTPSHSITLIWLMLGLYLTGCDGSTSAGSGSARINVNVQAISVNDVEGVNITVAGDGIDPPIVSALSNVEGEWQGVIEGIPAGADRTFTAEAIDADGVVLYVGSTEGITIENDKSVDVQILLQQASPPDSFENAVPRFTAIVISSTEVSPGETVSVRAEATDPNPDDSLTFSWRADAGSFEDASTNEVQWTAPDTGGEYRLTVSATDTQGATAMLSISITVRTGADGQATINLNLNTWPEVSGLSATPTRVDVDDVTQLALSVMDPDGDSLTFNWQANCDGSFDDAAAENPTFQLNSLPEGGADCVLIVDIADGQGGSNQASLSLATGPGLGDDNPTPPPGTLFTTGFETGEPMFVNLKSSGDVSNEPPEGTAPRTGSGVLTLSSITTTFTGRDLQSESCIPLENDQDAITTSTYAAAGADNGGNEISTRIALLWYTDSECSQSHENDETVGESTILTEGSYGVVSLDAVPPVGATHAKVRIQVRDDNGGDNAGDDFVFDDVLMLQ